MDQYRRGRDVERHDPRRPRVQAPYRPLIMLVWVIGAVLFLLGVPIGPQAALAVVLVTHVFFAGFIRTDIKILRHQGIEFGAWRHLWFGAALVLPFVAPVYYLYVGRRVRAENRRRGYDGDGGEVGSDDAAAHDADESTPTADESTPTADGDDRPATDDAPTDDAARNS